MLMARRISRRRPPHKTAQAPSFQLGWKELWGLVVPEADRADAGESWRALTPARSPNMEFPWAWRGSRGSKAREGTGDYTKGVIRTPATGRFGPTQARQLWR